MRIVAAAKGNMYGPYTDLHIYFLSVSVDYTSGLCPLTQVNASGKQFIYLSHNFSIDIILFCGRPSSLYYSTICLSEWVIVV
jgi:hypothetical protein